MSSHAPTGPNGFPLVQGIELVGTHELPDRLSSIFPFPLFNAVQSKCFRAIYHSDDNFVLSAPTGSGKTAVLELAICRLASQCRDQQFKVIYQAPTKSLCAERQKDWHAKFSHLGLKCAELTGDTEHSQLRHVQTADILVTTPEKWDSVTRKWRDHRKLMELIRLFLIDEVHILKEDRGASLEAVVSRMKSVGSDVRFVALSATVPNSEDIASWLGLNNRIPGLPAAREVFGEEFRPVRLQKHVFGIQANGKNDFAFDQLCGKHLPEVISSYSSLRKPIMVFCMTRKSTEVTARLLAQWWNESRPEDRFWRSSAKLLSVRDEGLRDCISAGVAFHHAGLELADRGAIEQGYLSGDINVICCTSTLAVGVNLPCHFVIIKNTVSYQAEGCKEYSDLEVMQMLGRAGRPQFDHNAVAVIMTRHEKVNRYEKMVSGQEILESKLHLNLIEHLNAEIGLGMIHDLSSAKTWLKGTFLFVRFRRNPDHYRLSNDSSSSNAGEIVDCICNESLQQLRQFSLITENPKITSTEFGDAMARYYIQFETMKLIMGLQRKAKISEILSAVAQASEFKSIRFRSGEKQMFKEINSSPSIKFPIKVDLALGPHKISLIIQATLGGLDMRNDGRYPVHSQQFVSDTSIIFQHIHRLIRCIIDCQIHLEDSTAARNALELSRSFGGRCWDDSPLQMLQIDKVGPVAVRKLVGANIQTIEELEETDSQRINMILSRNPPFGSNLLQDLKRFPKLRISLKMMGQPVMRSKDDNPSVYIGVKAELGFLNESLPLAFQKKPVHIIFLAETSDGHLVHFCKISAQKLGNGQDIQFSVELEDPQQLICCYASCDDIAGTLKYATLNPVIPASAFPASKWAKGLRSKGQIREAKSDSRPNSASTRSEDYGMDELDDSDLFAAGAADFEDIDQVDTDSLSAPQRPPCGNAKRTSVKRMAESWKPIKLSNGNWACNHSCKDKSSCKHLCCREGLERPPKPPKETQIKTAKKNTVKAVEKHSSMDEFFPVAKSKAEPVRVKTPSNISKRRSSPTSDGLRGTQAFSSCMFDESSSDPFDEDNGFSLSRTGNDSTWPKNYAIKDIPSSRRKDAQQISSDQVETVDLTHEPTNNRGVKRQNDQIDSVSSSKRPKKHSKPDEPEPKRARGEISDSKTPNTIFHLDKALQPRICDASELNTMYKDCSPIFQNRKYPDSSQLIASERTQNTIVYDDCSEDVNSFFPGNSVLVAPCGYGPIQEGRLATNPNELRTATPRHSETRSPVDAHHYSPWTTDKHSDECQIDTLSKPLDSAVLRKRSANLGLESSTNMDALVDNTLQRRIARERQEEDAARKTDFQNIDRWLMEEFGDIVEFV